MEKALLVYMFIYFIYNKVISDVSILPTMTAGRQHNGNAV